MTGPIPMTLRIQQPELLQPSDYGKMLVDMFHFLQRYMVPMMFMLQIIVQIPLTCIIDLSEYMTSTVLWILVTLPWRSGENEITHIWKM